MMHPTINRERATSFRLALAFAAIYIVWGSTFLAIRFAVQTLPPLVMMGARHLVAGIMLYTWVRWRGAARPSAQEWGAAFIAGGFLFLGCHGLLSWAEIRVPSGIAALLSATLPLWMVLLARVWRQEREISIGVFSGIALGLVGVAVLMGLVGNSWQTDPLSALAIVLGEFLWAIGSIYGRAAKRTSPPVIFSAMQMIAGGMLLWVVGLAVGEASALHKSAFQPRALISVAYMIVFGSIIAFTQYNWLLRVTTAAKVSTHSYVNPLVAVFLGWILAGEPVTLHTLVGATLVLASVALVSSRSKQAVVADHETPAVVAAD